MLTALQMEPGDVACFASHFRNRSALAKNLDRSRSMADLQNAGLAAAGTFVAIFRYAFAHLQHRRFAAMCTYSSTIRKCDARDPQHPTAVATLLLMIGHIH